VRLNQIRIVKVWVWFCGPAIKGSLLEKIGKKRSIRGVEKPPKIRTGRFLGSQVG